MILKSCKAKQKEYEVEAFMWPQNQKYFLPFTEKGLLTSVQH